MFLVSDRDVCLDSSSSFCLERLLNEQGVPEPKTVGFFVIFCCNGSRFFYS